MKLIFATNNQSKLKEMKEILSELNMEVLSPTDLGIDEDVTEDQDSFEGNAAKKALHIAEETGYLSLADDSGLCIETLNGKPGIYTARWAGENASGQDLVNHTIQKMKGIENRDAWFETAAVLATPEGETKTFKGKIRGKITRKPRGKISPKLPYDVIFSPEGQERTFAEMSSEEKNKLSHRGQAFSEMKEYLKRME